MFSKFNLPRKKTLLVLVAVITIIFAVASLMFVPETSEQNFTPASQIDLNPQYFTVAPLEDLNLKQSIPLPQNYQSCVLPKENLDG